MVIWIIINACITFYVGIATSSYVTKVIKDKIKLSNKLSKKEAFGLFFNTDLLIPYIAFPVACTAIAMIIGFIIEQSVEAIKHLHSYPVMPYNMYYTFFFYLFIIIILSAVTINIYLVGIKDNYGKILS